MIRVSLPIGGLLALSTMLVAGSCADNQWTILIRQNNVPEPGCVVPADLGASYRSNGILDVTDLGVDVGIGYLLTPAVTSGLRANLNQPNDNIVIIEGANVTLQSDGSTASDMAITALGELTRRNHRTSGSIPPGGAVGMLFDAIDDGQALRLREFITEGTAVVLIANVSVYGYVDGAYVETPGFDYPITVCKGCLVRDRGPCDQLLNTFIPAPGGACGLAMDGVVDCCTVGADPVCPAEGTLPPPMGKPAQD